MFDHHHTYEGVKWPFWILVFVLVLGFMEVRFKEVGAGGTIFKYTQECITTEGCGEIEHAVGDEFYQGYSDIEMVRFESRQAVVVDHLKYKETVEEIEVQVHEDKVVLVGENIEEYLDDITDLFRKKQNEKVTMKEQSAEEDVSDLIVAEQQPKSIENTEQNDSLDTVSVYQPPARKITANDVSCSDPLGGGTWSPNKQGILRRDVYPGDGSVRCEEVSVVCKYGTIRYGTVSSYGGQLNENLKGSCQEKSAPVVKKDQFRSCSFEYIDSSQGKTIFEHGSTVPYYFQGMVSESDCNTVKTQARCNDGVSSASRGFSKCISQKVY